MQVIIHQFVLQRISSPSQPPVGAIYTIDRESTHVGRDSSNDFVINDPTISRQHMVIEKHDDHTITLEDLGSRNGTFINDVRLTPSVRQPIRDGDVIQCGKVITFQYQIITQQMASPGIPMPPVTGSATETMDAARVDHVHVFLSYSRIDHPVMDTIAAALRAADLTVWADQTILPPDTAEWEQGIRHAIHQSDTVVVILSPEAERSDAVNREIAIAESLGKRIFPVLVRGTAEDAVPLGLISYQRIDARIDFAGNINLLIVALKYYLGLT